LHVRQPAHPFQHLSSRPIWGKTRVTASIDDNPSKIDRGDRTGAAKKSLRLRGGCLKPFGALSALLWSCARKHGHKQRSAVSGQLSTWMIHGNAGQDLGFPMRYGLQSSVFGKVVCTLSSAAILGAIKPNTEMVQAQSEQTLTNQKEMRANGR
jgi:hypothetical protein